MASPRSNADSTPICRCRVLYLGSAVPHVTKDGLQGIQEPLRELYPEQGAIGARGIDSWLSVWSNGILLENVDENHKKVTRFFPIETLHYCAAVRYVLVPEKTPGTSSTQPRFLPLDSPFARSPNPNHPPLFACILRRTTGIKVLECHTFICKREMAANALVRCCFHAYADSAYARHIDTGTGGYSVYGTVRNDGRMTSDPVSIEKVEGWRRTAPPMTGGGSTLTLDSALHPGHHPEDGPPPGGDRENSNSADDLSIYNGDENHKIWAGSGRDVSGGDDASYGEFGVNTVRSARSSRPRQTVSAPPPPPPPAKERAKKSTKERGKKKKTRSGSQEETYPSMNGSLLRSGTWKGSPVGAGMYPGRPYSNGRGNGGGAGGGAGGGGGFPVMMVAATLPHPHANKPAPPLLLPTPRMLPPNFLPVPPQPVYVHGGRKPSKNYPVTMEEPIYMPSNRPMSPVSSYQPCHFPHEAYLMQQYATTEDPKRRPRDKHKKNVASFVPGPDCVEWTEIGKGKERKRGKPSIGNSTVDRRSGEEDSDALYNTGGYRRKEPDGKSEARSNGYKREEDDGDSLYNTGIYRRKGHLNERAFSYSIRQEHRSRSYGSLANLKFAPLPVVPNGGGPPVEAQYYGVTKEEMKKEREIMQMMQDLELSGDELERSEVPPGIYQPANQRNNKIRR